MGKGNYQTKGDRQAKKDYAPSVGFFPAKNGNENAASIYVDENVYDVIQKIELGGRLSLFRTSEETQEKGGPAFRMVLSSKREVEQFSKNRDSGRDEQGSSEEEETI